VQRLRRRRSCGLLLLPDLAGRARRDSGLLDGPGRRVDGFAREVAVVPAAAFTRAPAGWSHQEAATLTTAAVTAWRALAVEGQVKAGETVLLLGTGGVSVFALQLAKAMGARVIITSSSDEKLARCGQMGADHTLNYRQTPEWGEAVRALTGGRGVDHVLEVGGPTTMAQSIAAVRAGGTIHMIGALSGWAGDDPQPPVAAQAGAPAGVPGRQPPPTRATWCGPSTPSALGP
jgi:NADPH:quinone reductase-like Zn-dependent oxidoreductase